jgi:hypothetical protein
VTAARTLYAKGSGVAVTLLEADARFGDLLVEWPDGTRDWADGRDFQHVPTTAAPRTRNAR